MSDGANQAASVQNEVGESRAKKAKIPQKSTKVLDGITELYRHYDEWNRLLYVGVSCSSVERLWRHMEKCAWRDLIVTVKIERYFSRKQALAAERAAIKAENPYYNKIHNGLWRIRKWEHPLKEYASASLLTPRT